MDQITFTGVVLKSFSRDHQGGSARFSSNITADNRRAMGWDEFPTGYTSGKLEGSLAGSTAQLQPVDGALSKWLIEFQVTTVKAFEAVRYELEGKKKKGYRYELHFICEFTDMTACRELEGFMTHIGDHKSTLVVSYTKAAEQLPLEDQLGEERRQATMAEND